MRGGCWFFIVWFVRLLGCAGFGSSLQVYRLGLGLVRWILWILMLVAVGYWFDWCCVACEVH